MGQTPLARAIKALLRPIVKVLYYLLRTSGRHKLLSLLLILLFLASSSAMTYYLTGAWPFGIGSDPFHAFNIHGNGSGDQVKNWLYDLRNGNAAGMKLLQAQLTQAQPPDADTLVAQFSQPKGRLVWKMINVVGVWSEADTTVDSFVEVDIAQPGPGGTVNGYLIWHFTTLPQQGRILSIDLVSFRAPLPAQ